MSKLNNDKVSVELDLRAQKAQEEIHKLTKEIENIRKQNTEHRKEISRLAATEGDYSAEIKRLNETIRANTKEIDNRKKAIQSEREKIDISRMSAADLGKELKQLKKQLANTSKATNIEAYKKLEAEICRTEKAYAQATKSTRGFLVSLLSLDKISTSIKGFFMGIGMVITTYVLGAFSSLVDTIQDFEKANSKLASVLRTNLDGISRLTEQAKFLGRTTTATASQVTGLQTELAKLGFSQDVIEKLTPATLKFAKAVDTDLSSAAAFAGAAMRIFNKDASEAESVMATFAVATTASALDFSKLQSSLATVGPVAHSFGFTVEETTALLGQLSNAGFDASSAATATRNILLNLADTNGDLAKALGGPVTNLDELVAGLRKLNAEGVDLKKVLDLTDKRSAAAFSTFLDGADNLLLLRDAITGCTGDFNTMTKTMTDNAAGSWAGFQSAVEGLILKFFDLRVALKVVYEWATEFVNWIGSWVDALAPLGEMIAYTAKGFAAMVSVVGQLVGWFSSFITQTKVGRIALNALVVVLIAYKTQALRASLVTKSFYTNIGTAVKSAMLFVKAIGAKIVAMVKDAAVTVKAAVAQRSFNAALLGNPLTLFLGVLAAVVAAIIEFNSTMDDAVEETDAWTAASREAVKQYGEQKAKIEALIMVAENEALSLDRRRKAVLELNRIIPGYNAKIDETTKKYTASKKALDDYLVSLEKEMRYKANAAKMEELLKTAEAARDAYDQAILDAESASDKKSFVWQKSAKEKAMVLRRETKAEWDKAEADYQGFKQRMEKAMEDGVIVPPKGAEEETAVEKTLDRTNAKASETVTRLREINTELKRLRKIDPQSDEELDDIQKNITRLQDERKQLLKKNKGKCEPGTYAEGSLTQATAPVDDAHQRRLLEINKEDMTNAERTIAKNEELIRYCGELNTALDDLRANTAQSHTKTLDAITAEQNKLAQQAVTAQQNINKAMVQQDSDTHNQRLEACEAFYRTQSDLIKASVIADGNLQQAAGVYQMELDKQNHEDRLKELQRYYDEVAEADYYTKDEKTKIFQQLGKEIQQLQSQILTDTGKFSEALREAMTDTTSAEGIAAGFERQIQALDAYYEALKSADGVSAEDAVALEDEKQRRIAAIRYQASEEQWQLKELTGLSWGEEYKRELEQLDNFYEQGLIKEKDYQAKKLALGANHAKKYFDYYSQLSGSMFSAIQDAEIAKSDAKYDALIQQAKNNGEDTAALEEEKENKKLEIQKKYADVNFAIKVSQIIADTAVAIMKAFADLGPIGGALAAAMLTATGAAQVMSASAERDKIKNMQPSRTAGSSTEAPAKAERVLTGYVDGGYTGDGGRYEVAGVVHRGEYVIPKHIMRHPKVVDTVGMIEAIRRSRQPGVTDQSGGSLPGYADGGIVRPANRNQDNETVTVLRDLKKAIKDMRAYVVYQDIEDAGETMRRARNPFTRKNKES